MRGLRVLAGGPRGRARGAARRRRTALRVRREPLEDGASRRRRSPRRRALVALERIDGGWRLTTPHRTSDRPPRGRVRRRRQQPSASSFGSARAPARATSTSPRRPSLRATRARGAGLCDFDLRVADDGIEGYYWDFPTVVDGAPARQPRHLPRELHRAARSEAAPGALAGRARGVDIASVNAEALQHPPARAGRAPRARGAALWSVRPPGSTRRPARESRRRSSWAASPPGTSPARSVGGDGRLDAYAREVLHGDASGGTFSRARGSRAGSTVPRGARGARSSPGSRRRSRRARSGTRASASAGPRRRDWARSWRWRCRGID